MQVSGTQHTGFSVVDLDASIAFYALLGCEVAWRRTVTDTYFRSIVGLPDTVVQAAHLRVPGSSHIIELFQYEPQLAPARLAPNQPGHTHLCFLVDDLETAYAELLATGVEFTSPPVTITAGVNAGGSGVYLRDPSGNQLELFQPPRIRA
jgi:catechol 2,3-dioxygenase-like lactoylglutathione lyase family enzyme